MKRSPLKAYIKQVKNGSPKIEKRADARSLMQNNS